MSYNFQRGTVVVDIHKMSEEQYGWLPNPTKILRKNSYDSGWVSISVRLGKRGFPGFLPVEGLFRRHVKNF